MLHLKWTGKNTNQRVLQQAEVRSLVAKIKERKKTWVRHILTDTETYCKES